MRTAASAVKEKRSLANMPKETKTVLGKEGAAVAQRDLKGGSTPHARQELYEEARKKDLPGRSKMGRDELA